MPEKDEITLWIDKLKEGDDQAMQVIWEQYFQKLITMARRRLAGANRRVSDEEDIALSAMNAFFQGASNGRFPKLDDRLDLWKLLVTITTRKSFDRMKHDRAAKRGGGQVHGESAFVRRGDDDVSGGIGMVMGSEPTPELAAMVAENCASLLDQLDDDLLREVARKKLEGFTNREIGEQLDVSHRAVERKLALIRSTWLVEEEE